MKQHLFFRAALVLWLVGLFTLAGAQELIKIVNLSESGYASYPAMFQDSLGQIHVLWVDEDLYYRMRSTDGKWSAAENLTDNFNLLIDSYSGLAESPDGLVCVFWIGQIEGTHTLDLFKHCVDIVSGEWNELENLGSTGRDHLPAFSQDGRLHLVYITGGGTLNYNHNEEPLYDERDAAYRPQFLIAPDDTLHVMFMRQRAPYTLEHFYSLDGGQSWKERVRVNLLNGEVLGSTSIFNMVADAEGGLHVVFNASGVNNSIYYSAWTLDGGWEAPTDIRGSAGSSSSTTFALAVDPEGRAHALWHGISMLYTHQQEDGTWTVPAALADYGNTGPGPIMSVDAEGTIHLVWQHTQEREIYYANIAP